MESIEQMLDRIEKIYDAAVERLREDVIAFGRDRDLPAPERRSDGSYAYPELRLRFRGGDQPEDRSRAFGRLNAPGLYTTTVTRPRLFRDYLQRTARTDRVQLRGRGRSRLIEAGNPFPLCPRWRGRGGTGGGRPATSSPGIFPRPNSPISATNWPMGSSSKAPNRRSRCRCSTGLRTDFSLARLAHYTGTAPEHFQRFVLFTNYHRYVDEFVDWAGSQLGENGYTALAGAGGLMLTEKTDNARAQLSDTAWRRHQMPAYHLVGPNHDGITLVNIGVGPSNAKTICDHLAVLRPEAWLMIGHCGGLRPSQKIGDYVLAHAYLRDDHVLDPVLPPEIPLPAIAEVQQALAGAAQEVSGTHGADLKKRMRTGTVVTTDDRNWELRYTSSAHRMSLSRAVGVDMESATIAGQGYRFRVPYGTLLCVSDKPLHGEIKLPGQANDFYEQAIAAHLQIGVTACRRLREEGPRLHSRKLRAFNEPPFR